MDKEIKGVIPPQNNLIQMETYLFNAMARLDKMGKLDETQLQLESSRNAQLKGIAETLLHSAKVQIDSQKLVLDIAKAKYETIDPKSNFQEIPILENKNA